MAGFIRKHFGWLITLFVSTICQINWKITKRLSDEDLKLIQHSLAKDYYIICTRSPNTLSNHLICFIHWLLTGTWGFYSHALMNLESDTDDPLNFRLIEATLKHGASIDSFDWVFHDVASVALLKPKSFQLEQWTLVMEKATKELGKQYDTLYDLTNDSRVSCVELVLNALKADPNYSVNYANFIALSKQYGELTPHMIYTCPDFEVVLEIRAG